MIQCFLFHAHIGGGTHSKGNHGHSVVLEAFLIATPPHKSVKVAVRLRQFYSSIHFADVSCQYHTIKAKTQEHINECRMHSRSYHQRIIEGDARC